MIFHYQFGVYVEAVDSDDAWEQVREISQQLDKIDAEEESAVEVVEIFASEDLTKPLLGENGQRITVVSGGKMW